MTETLAASSANDEQVKANTNSAVIVICLLGNALKDFESKLGYVNVPCTHVVSEEAAYVACIGGRALL